MATKDTKNTKGEFIEGRGIHKKQFVGIGVYLWIIFQVTRDRNV